MDRVINVGNDLVTPYELMTQIFRVNVVLNTDQSSDPKKLTSQKLINGLRIRESQFAP